MERLVTEDQGRVALDVAALRRVEVGLVAGEVVVASTPGPGRVEVEWLGGPPVKLWEEDGVLVVRHQTTRWPTERPRALVSVQCPPGTELRTSTVTASTVVVGLAGEVSAASVSGGLTLGFVGGDVRVKTVSGPVEMEGVSGRLRVDSVSGPVGLAAGRLTDLSASSASGGMTMDLETLPAGSYRCVTVSGDIRIRVPADVMADVEAVSVSGPVDLDGHRGGRGPRSRRTTIGSSGSGSTAAAVERARIVMRSVSGRLAVVTRTGTVDMAEVGA